MIKLSEMYRISGGCKKEYACCKCANHIGEKDLTCIVYPKDYGTIWDGNRMACKYFRKRTEDDQMDISDLIRLKLK